MTSSINTERAIADELVWFKSSYSGGNETECVEVATVSDQVFVRDSKLPAGRRFGVEARAWAGFVASVRDMPRP
ncbi:hypothetical protein GCM10010277_15380 [Streptomyces longisporoflavus]|uniref:DUF397 domain-containing protein n=1 Tax=Streptomyces longisporoflavus TaxID=28044 RepID=UPI00167D9C9C|nr:DUF397 domain-containing protein [Streptomyces longisporoflavus]GGV31582.1 hypothetical protein GCM10010277_15380 [Streptomyces longisporoflavus]